MDIIKNNASILARFIVLVVMFVGQKSDGMQDNRPFKTVMLGEYKKYMKDEALVRFVAGGASGYVDENGRPQYMVGKHILLMPRFDDVVLTFLLYLGHPYLSDVRYDAPIGTVFVCKYITRRDLIHAVGAAITDMVINHNRNATSFVSRIIRSLVVRQLIRKGSVFLNMNYPQHVARLERAVPELPALLIKQAAQIVYDLTIGFGVALGSNCCQEAVDLWYVGEEEKRK